MRILCWAKTKACFSQLFSLSNWTCRRFVSQTTMSVLQVTVTRLQLSWILLEDVSTSWLYPQVICVRSSETNELCLKVNVPGNVNTDDRVSIFTVSVDCHRMVSLYVTFEIQFVHCRFYFVSVVIAYLFLTIQDVRVLWRQFIRTQSAPRGYVALLCTHWIRLKVLFYLPLKHHSPVGSHC